MTKHKSGSFQSFTSFISTPDFINDEAHQPHSYSKLLVNLGIVRLHGDPNILNKALKHLGAGPAVQAAPTHNRQLGKVTVGWTFKPLVKQVCGCAAPGEECTDYLSGPAPPTRGCFSSIRLCFSMYLLSTTVRQCWLCSQEAPKWSEQYVNQISSKAILHPRLNVQSLFSFQSKFMSSHIAQ